MSARRTGTELASSPAHTFRALSLKSTFSRSPKNGETERRAAPSRTSPGVGCDDVVPV